MYGKWKSPVSGKKQQQHIHFDDDENSDEDIQIIEVDQSQSKSESESQKNSSSEIKISIRKSSEESFGFEVKGEEKRRGENCVDNVVADSAAYRANLLVGDRIVSVNGYRVNNMNINELFSLLEYESEIDPKRLDLVVFRNAQSQKRSKLSFIWGS